MKTNKLDNNIKEKLQNRTFKPSASAWERLSIQLDEQPQQKKRGWFFYIGAAASILLLIAIGIQFLFSDDATKEIKTNNIIVNTNIDSVNIDKKINEFIKEIPLEEAIVKKDSTNTIKKEKVPTKREFIERKTEKNVIKRPIVIAEVNKTDFKINNAVKKEVTQKSKVLTSVKQDPNSRIKINSDDLLFAVTHSSSEVEAYYAKNNLTREDVLKTIKSELKKTNIKVNPNTILAEVERNIGQEDFQNKFMKSIKKRVSDLATAIASRND